MRGMLSLSDADAYLLLEPRDDPDSGNPPGVSTERYCPSQGVTATIG